MSLFKRFITNYKLILVLTFASLSAGYFLRHATQYTKVYAQTMRKGYTATILKNQYDGQGNVEIASSIVVAKKPSGSTSTITERFRKGQSTKSISLQLIEELKQITSFYGAASKVTTRMSKEKAAQLMSASDSACVLERGQAQVTASPELILGFSVVKKTETTSGPDSKTAVTEIWFAPLLDCLPMKKVRQVLDANQSIVVREVSEVSRVVLGEPDPALFTLPANYVERNPSEVYAAEAARLGDENCVRCPRPMLSNSDSLYLKSKY